MRQYFHHLNTLILAIIGVGLFSLADLPLPFLFGPMFSCLIAALIGIPLKGFGQISTAARTILGVAVGASITPAIIPQLGSLISTLLLIPLIILIIGYIGTIYFQKFCRFDFATAYYAAMPGGLQDMIIFGIEAGGNPRILSLVHATRVLIIVTAAPFILIHFYGASLTNPIGLPITDLPIVQLILMVAAALIGWKGGVAIGLFGASILGPLIVTALLSLTGFIETRPPEEAILAAQFFLGSAIGIHYIGITITELRNIIGYSIIYTALLTALAVAFAQLAQYLAPTQPILTFLAFAPGGQAEMTILAIIAGVDLSYVVIHHLTRIVTVIIGAPLIAKLLNDRTNHRK